MTKRRLLFFVAAGLFLIVAMVTLPFQVGSARGNWQEQTWPSRTPTPQGGPNPTDTPPGPPPTTDPGGGGGGGGNNSTATPQPNNTPDPSATDVPTTAPTVVLQTPIGGYEPTAQPCGVPPTLLALGRVNVRRGPGLDYEPIGSLIYLESRPIVGRAEFATWWQVQLPNNVLGWVANQAVSVQGYTGLVPIVDPPALDGATPTPGPLWEPTPNPVCTPLPTPTATSTVAVIEAGPVGTTQPISSSPTDEPVEPTATPEPPTATATIEAAPTETAVPAATNPPTIGEDPTPEGNDEDPAPSTSSWILFVGVGLLVVGAVSLVFRRR